MVLSSMYSPGLSAEGQLLGTLENNADSPRKARKICCFFHLFTNLEQLSLATDGRFGVEPEVGGSGGVGDDVRESTGNPCYRKPPS